jgi:EAL domain-containing protein (putative c-di-GMP-specific phosphodiesterase class I)
VGRGPEGPCAEAEAQLGAIAYALGEAMPEENGGLVPETRVRHASFAGEPDTPEGLIARLLAACAVTQTLPATAVRVDDALVEKERDRYAMEQELRSALANGEFELHYQPQVDCAAGRIAGAEALLRWNNPNRGMVSPGIFVPLLESAGLIEEVGLWALNAAIRDFSLWRAPSFASLTVAVNVSSHQLAEAGFHQRIHRMLESHGLAPRRLEIELTESAAAADVTRAARLFEAIRASGVRIAIDDFGTGFSSLSALRTLHFDKIKIDREFVTHVDTRRDSQAICQSIVALARGLGIRVLAEGVERREEYLWLRQHGCNEFQGFYFAQPLDRAAFRHFTADRRRIADLTDTTPRKLQHSIVKRLAP